MMAEEHLDVCCVVVISGGNGNFLIYFACVFVYEREKARGGVIAWKSHNAGRSLTRYLFCFQFNRIVQFLFFLLGSLLWCFPLSYFSVREDNILWWIWHEGVHLLIGLGNPKLHASAITFLMNQ